MPVLMTEDKCDGHIRIGHNTNKWLDDYQFVCSFIKTEDTIEIFAACGKLDMDLYQQLRDFLKEKGFKKVIYNRVNNGKLSKRTISL